MDDPDDFVVRRLRPRPTRSVSIAMPTDVIDTLRELAAERDMSLQALVRLYVGQGMRVDISRRWAERGGGEG
jgi:hypothetical protein